MNFCPTTTAFLMEDVKNLLKLDDAEIESYFEAGALEANGAATPYCRGNYLFYPCSFDIVRTKIVITLLKRFVDLERAKYIADQFSDTFAGFVDFEDNRIPQKTQRNGSRDLIGITSFFVRDSSLAIDATLLHELLVGVLDIWTRIEWYCDPTRQGVGWSEKVELQKEKHMA